MGQLRNCGSQCEVFRRVIGYYAPSMNSSLGKQEEYKMRKNLNVNETGKAIAEENELMGEIINLNDFVIENLDTSSAITTLEREALLAI